MRLKMVSELEPNECFIWADDDTRDYMCTDEVPERLQVLRCIEIREHDRVIVKCLDGTSHYLYFQPRDRVIVINLPSRNVHPDVRCDSCGGRYGNHFTGLDPMNLGISCSGFRSGDHFVPNEESLREYHGSAMQYRGAKSDFFADIGL
jgi:hypothetical protein